MRPQYFHQSSPIIFNFIFSSVNWGRIQEFERHGLPLPVHCMGKSFKVSIYNFVFFVFCCFVFQRVTFCFCLFFKLSLAITTGVDACPVFVFHLRSFDYDAGKEARDVVLTCRCHPSNIIPDNIFND